MSNIIKIILDGQKAIADLQNEGFFNDINPDVELIFQMALTTTPRKEWDSWTKEKLMKTPNARYWEFVRDIDY